MMQTGTFSAIVVLGSALFLSACSGDGQFFPDIRSTNASAPPAASSSSDMAPPPRSRAMDIRPVSPDSVMACRGHVLVPALGMTFVPRGAQPPSSGRYLREENVTPPYRVLPPNAAATTDINPDRLNVYLDGSNRIVDLRCG